MVLTDSQYNVGLMNPSTRWRQMKQCEVAALALQGEWTFEKHTVQFL